MASSFFAVIAERDLWSKAMRAARPYEFFLKYKDIVKFLCKISIEIRWE